MTTILQTVPDMGPIWGRQGPGGPRVGPMIFAIWDIFKYIVVDVDICILIHISQNICSQRSI